MSDAEPPPGLDPDRAIEAARGNAGDPDIAPRREWKPEPPIDTRRYQWMIGGFGLILVIIFSIYLYARGGSSTTGVPAGQPAHRFVAPLATSNLDAAANAHPRCDPAHPAKRGLNVCWRQPTVLVLFVASGYAPCVREVNAVQQVAASFPKVQFAAVAVNANRSTTARLVRRHHWTIPVAYDLTGAIGEVYGFVVCPLVELVRPGGIVAQRLIGEQWEQPAALSAAIRRSLDPAGGMTGDEELRSVPGFVEPAVANEFPGLRLDWLTVEVRDGDSPPSLVGQLRELSNRYRGAVVVALRTKPIPAAYRTFFRQIGLDPDQTRIPSEEAAVQRLFHGAFRSAGRVADALLVALVETGVAIFALDGDRVGPGGPGIRTAQEGEHLGDERRPRYLEAGTLVVADESTVHGVLFGETSAPVVVRRGHHRLVLYAVAVAGVPEIHIEEAFWVALEGLRG